MRPLFWVLPLFNVPAPGELERGCLQSDYKISGNEEESVARRKLKEQAEEWIQG